VVRRPTPGQGTLVEAVASSCAVAHHTGPAIAAAALVAGVVTEGLETPGHVAPGQALDRALAVGLEAARLGARRGDGATGDEVVAAAELAVRLARDTAGDDAEFLALLAGEVGSSVAAAESVPAAVACLVRAGGDPWRAVVLGANLGGDTDTVAALAGAMAAALPGTPPAPRRLAARLRQGPGAEPGEVAALASALWSLRR
jgi:ADP-ribosylglycohydrolase